VRRRYLFSLIALLGCLSAPAAHADAVTFDISGVLVSTAGPSSISGNVTLDTATGLFTDSNFDVIYGGTSHPFTGAPFSAGTISSTLSFADFGASFAYFFGLDLPVGSLIGYDGGLLCSDTSPCVNPKNPVEASFISITGVNYDVSTGTLTPIPASVPEPSSLMLFGPAALGVLATLRRRR
jgi:hypothetical protein